MKALLAEFNLFRTAIVFYTRLPLGKGLPYSPEALNQSTRYFTLTGMLVGIWSAGIWQAAFWLFGNPLAIGLSMAAAIVLTGAFHEDGFADFCDGFGGGWDKIRILEIMKDSRIGTYGTIGLIAMLGLKYLSLITVPTDKMWPVLIAAHAFSRLMPVVIIRTSQYVREDALSKSKPIGQNITNGGLATASVFGLVPLAWLPAPVWGVVAAGLLLVYFFRGYLHRWIGGYTGDCLGALQQLSELLFYLSAILAFRL